MGRIRGMRDRDCLWSLKRPEMTIFVGRKTLSCGRTRSHRGWFRIGPVRSVLNPLSEVCNDRLGQLLVQRHLQRVIVSDGWDQRPLVRFSRNDGWSALAPGEQSSERIDVQPALFGLSAMALEAVLDEDGTNLLLKELCVFGRYETRNQTEPRQQSNAPTHSVSQRVGWLSQGCCVLDRSQH